jgi:hypothetical protein
MSYEFYRVVHVVGVLFLFSTFGVLAASAGSSSSRLRKVASITHGVALTVIFVAGFGLLARLEYFGNIPIWGYLKMVLWAALGLAVVAFKKRPEWAPALWIAMPVLGGLAAWLAINQPF